jgi:hypothetical protein
MRAENAIFPSQDYPPRTKQGDTVFHTKLLAGWHEAGCICAGISVR